MYFIPAEQLFLVVIKTMEETFVDCLCSNLNPKSFLDILNNSLVLLTTLYSKESGTFVTSWSSMGDD